MGLKLVQRGEALFKHAQHRLGVVALGYLFQHVATDLDHLALRSASGGNGFLKHGMVGGVATVHQDARGLAQFDRLGDDLKALGQKQPGLLALLAHVQGARGLDRWIGQGGDRSGVGHAVQRAKKDRPISRWPCSSARVSSPHSIRPPRPLSASPKALARAGPLTRAA